MKRKNILAALKMHIVYTFPIFLHYSGKFDEIQSVFDHYQLLSMIKVKERNGVPCPAGIDIIRQIIGKRADLDLFVPDALDFLIRQSGGSLRHIFEIIQDAVLDVHLREENAQRVDVLGVENAFIKLRNYFG